MDHDITSGRVVVNRTRDDLPKFFPAKHLQMHRMMQEQKAREDNDKREANESRRMEKYFFTILFIAEGDTSVLCDMVHLLVSSRSPYPRPLSILPGEVVWWLLFGIIMLNSVFGDLI